MARPSSDHLGGRYSLLVEFDMPTVKPTRSFLREQIKWALETPAYDPNLYCGLGQVTIKSIARVK